MTLDERYSRETPSGIRLPSRQDRDRILYSSQFRRLAGVTQVASATEQLLIHNRITHSTKVEQVGMGIVDFHDNRDRQHPDAPRNIGEALGRAAEWRVGAAGLAHDLGHPPFGHIGEQTLHALVTCEKHRSAAGPSHERFADRTAEKESCCTLPDGFEGNAQTLRIVTKLTARDNPSQGNVLGKPPVKPYRRGLDLTRGTLQAISKYPWLRGDQAGYPKKWGAYDCDFDVLLWTFETDAAGYGNSLSAGHQDRTLEASIMDWADDITYAVHDIDDFFRLRLVPLHELVKPGRARDSFLEYASATVDFKFGRSDDPAELREFVVGWMGQFPPRGFSDLPEDLAKINGLVSDLINEFITNTTVTDRNVLDIPSNIRYLNGILKQLTWFYVIDNPSLATMQVGQQRMLERLYEHIYDLTKAHYLDEPSGASKAKSDRRIPAMLRFFVDYTMERDDGCQKAYRSDSQRMARGILDFLSSLTDSAVHKLYGRLIGEPGVSILDPAIAM